MAETAVDAIDMLERNSGRHPGYRRLQARGVCFQGTFTPSGDAARLTTAAHLRHDPVPATVRFSGSDGNPAVPDTERVIRGLTARFHLPHGADTDLIAVSLPVFLAATPEEFIEGLEAARPDPVTGAVDVARIGAYIGKHPQTAPAFEAMSMPPPVSYATVRYSALHAYVWVDESGRRQAVRYRWEPDEPVAVVGEDELAALGPQYLTEELRGRLEHGAVGFSLRVQLAAAADPTHDATIAWPDDRAEIVAGHLRLTSPVDDPDRWEAERFDPTRLTPGIELSDDPLLLFRKAAYAESYRRRTEERG